MQERLQQTLSERDGCLEKKHKLISNVPLIKGTLEQKQDSVIDLREEMVRDSETLE